MGKSPKPNPKSLNFCMLGQMDELLPVALEDAITLFLRALGVMIINSVANWFSVLIAIPTILVFIWLRQYYLKTAREVKRLDGIMRSPMYNHVTNSIQVIILYSLQISTQNLMECSVSSLDSLVVYIVRGSLLMMWYILGLFEHKSIWSSREYVPPFQPASRCSW